MGVEGPKFSAEKNYFKKVSFLEPHLFLLAKTFFEGGGSRRGVTTILCLHMYSSEFTIHNISMVAKNMEDVSKK